MCARPCLQRLELRCGQLQLSAELSDAPGLQPVHRRHGLRFLFRPLWLLLWCGGTQWHCTTTWHLRRAMVTLPDNGTRCVGSGYIVVPSSQACSLRSLCVRARVCAPPIVLLLQTRCIPSVGDQCALHGDDCGTCTRNNASIFLDTGAIVGSEECGWCVTHVASFEKHTVWFGSADVRLLQRATADAGTRSVVTGEGEGEGEGVGEGG